MDDFLIRKSVYTPQTFDESMVTADPDSNSHLSPTPRRMKDFPIRKSVYTSLDGRRIYAHRRFVMVMVMVMVYPDPTL